MQNRITVDVAAKGGGDDVQATWPESTTAAQASQASTRQVQCIGPCRTRHLGLALAACKSYATVLDLKLDPKLTFFRLSWHVTKDRLLYQ